ncbi:hypothetical protein, partial [Leptodesmis sp.]|uniref:hypothetical protein n=1 Tax=Leptodesmis sp. TaxID=3100501 RepID=UPI00405353BD
MLYRYFLLSGCSLALLFAGCTPTPPSATSSPSPVTSPASTTPSAVELQPAVQQAIASYIKQQGAPPEDSDRFFADTIDLNGDGTRDAIVVLSTSYWCGTGGCTMLVLEGQKDKTFRLVSESTLVRPPVTVSDSKTNGWRDLISDILPTPMLRIRCGLPKIA